ncbi:MAG: FKBP-type peptidyl-prolyl cis-trans isomerase [Arenimonas sp.]|nr:FKBP-type peptidyl-prolyl cis-trans isomerase [Arenimonas sp.]
MNVKSVNAVRVCVSSLLLLWAVQQNVLAQSIAVMPGMSYTVKEKSKTPNASVSEFVDYSAQLTGPDGKSITSAFVGNKTFPMQKLKTSYPALARMILLMPIGESSVWTISAENLPPDVTAKAGNYRLVLKVMGSPNLLKAPDNLMLPPSTAIRTASGLRYIVLKHGNGTTHPLPSSTITIDYIGWDRSGKVFDSSIQRGEPSSFPLPGLIKGWQEGVLLMSPGDTFRFWIPGALAYDSIPSGNSPHGQLVFDITLLDFKATP